MTKQELYKKYGIEAEHTTWDFVVDGKNSFEVFRKMNEGKSPKLVPFGTVSSIIGFLDNKELCAEFPELEHTAKRMIYRYQYNVLKHFNTRT